jgi:hypothetical protein
MLTPSLTLDTFEDIRKYEQAQSEYSVAVIALCEYLGEHMKMFDDINVDTKSENKSLLFNMINFVNQSDGNYVQSQIRNRKEDFDRCIQILVSTKKIKLINNVIIASSGAPKIPIKSDNMKIRRVSFVGTNFGDADRPLNLEDVKNMKDLTFLFSLNGYRLPYTISSLQRSMYETFFGDFLDMFVDTIEVPKEHEAYRYKVLKDSIYTLHTIAELYIDIIECLLEMISVINSRIKTASGSIDKKIIIEQFSCPLFEHLFACFNNEDKAFSVFKKRKLLNSKIGDEERHIKALKASGNSIEHEQEQWIAKIDGYVSSLDDIMDMYKITSVKCTQTILALKNPLEEKITTFCDNILMFIEKFEMLLDSIFNPNGVCQKFLTIGHNLLLLIDSLEKRYPVKYGSASSSPRRGTQKQSSFITFISAAKEMLSPRK